MTDQEQSHHQKKTINPETIPLVVAEYNALREDILKSKDLQHQITSVALIALGTLLPIGLQTKNASIILIYPIMGLFLAAAWLSHSHAVHKVASYIQKRIELKVGVNNIGWEHYIRENIEPYLVIGFLGTRAIFIATELLAIIVGISIAKFNVTENVLLVASVLSTALTIIMLVVVELRRVHNKKLFPY